MKWSAEVVMSLGMLRLDAALSGDTRTVALIGPNGSGKSTILRAIAGLYRPATGAIRIDDQTLLDTKAGIDRPTEQRRLGYVPQGFGLFPHLNVVDNVAFGLGGGGDATARAERRRRATDVLDDLGCGALTDRAVRGLSGGERQRVALARALVVDPVMLLLDEPLSALDVASRRSVRSFLADRLSERNRPALVVTHDARDVRALDAFVHVLDEGRIVQLGSAQELSARPANDFVAEFFAA